MTHCQWADAWGGMPCTRPVSGELVWTYLAFRAVELCAAHLAQEMPDEARDWLDGRGAEGYHPEILDGARGWPADPMRQPPWDPAAEHPGFQAVTAVPYAEPAWDEPRRTLSVFALPPEPSPPQPPDHPLAAQMGYAPQPPQTGTPPRKPPKPPSDPWNKPGIWQETTGWQMCQWNTRWPDAYACPRVGHYRRSWRPNGRETILDGLFCEDHSAVRKAPEPASRGDHIFAQAPASNTVYQRLMREGLRDRRLIPPPEPVDPWPWMQGAIESLAGLRANTIRLEHAIGVRFKGLRHELVSPQAPRADHSATNVGACEITQ